MKFKVKGFQLNELGKQAGAVTELLQSFGKQKESANIFMDAEERLLELLALSEGAARDDKQNTPRFNKNGIKKMFSILSENKAITSAPSNEKERAKFYQTIAYGYKFIGDTIKEEFNFGNMEKEDVYSCIDSIGDGAHACAGRWRSVLEELVRGFSHTIKVPGLDKELEPDRLKEQLGELFYRGSVIEGNKASEEFVNTYYPGMSVGNRVHYTTFFKRALNAQLDYHLPTTMEEDSYILEQQFEIFRDVAHYLKKASLDERIVERVLSLTEEMVKTDSKLYEGIVNYAIGEYHKSETLNKKYEDAAAFISEEIFQGFSKNIKKEALLDLIKNKGFAKLVEKELEINLRRELTAILYRDTPSRKIERLLENHPQGLSLLDEIKPLLSKRNIYGENLLLLAAKNNMKKLTLFLLNQDLNIETVDKNQISTLHWAAYRGNIEAVALLIEKGAKLNEQNSLGNTPLYYAGKWGDIKLTELLLENGAKPDIQNNLGQSPLMRAIHGGYTEVAKRILEKSINLEIKDQDNCAALHWAAYKGNKEVLGMLLDKSVELNERNKAGATALCCAASYGHLNTLSLFIEKKAALDIPLMDGCTALMKAIENGYTEIAKVLIDKGANLEMTNHKGENPLQLAKNLNNTELVQRIQEKSMENICRKILKNKVETPQGIFFGA